MLCGKFKVKSKEKEVFVYEQYAPNKKFEERVQGGKTETDSDKVSSLSSEQPVGKFDLCVQWRPENNEELNVPSFLFTHAE